MGGTINEEECCRITMVVVRMSTMEVVEVVMMTQLEVLVDLVRETIVLAVVACVGELLPLLWL